MLMENLEVWKSSRAVGASVGLGGDRVENCDVGVKENDNLGNDLLEDLDSYMDDINDRLTISRMVSDSIIKGMVNAIEQEALKKIEMKEFEVVKLMKTFHYNHVSADEIEATGSPIRLSELKIKNALPSMTFTNLIERDTMKAHLGNLRVAAKEQFNNLEREIDNLKGYDSIMRTNPGSELTELGGIHHERWINAKKLQSSLRTMLDNVYNQVDKIVCMYDISLQDRQQEQQFQEEIEGMVVRNFIQNLQGKFERRLWDQNALFNNSDNTKWVENIKEISVLRQELDAISKSISLSETGLTSQGSFVIGEKADVFHGKTLLGDANERNGSKTIVPEHFEAAQLVHMSKDELVTYFKTQMTEMKRGHESAVQEMTEEYFRLKREYFKERGYSLQLKKDKEFDALRKKIPEIISNLDSILVENEKLSALSNNAKSLDSLKNRLDTLYSENCLLRNLLMEKKKENKYLSSQMSDASKKLSQLYFHEANLLTTIENLEDSVEDAHIEASISEEVCKCILVRATSQIKINSEVSAAHSTDNAAECYAEDLNIQSTIMQELLGVISIEAIKDAKENVSTLKSKLRNENEVRVSLERQVLEKEKTLNLEIKEKERMKKAIILLESKMEEKEKILGDAMATLANEKDQLAFANQELNKWRDLANQKQLLIFESDKELEATKDRLSKALKQIDLYTSEMIQLNQKLEVVTNVLSEMDAERRTLLAVSNDKQDTSLLLNTKMEEKKLMDSVIGIVHALSKEVADFERQIAEDIEIKSWRLENVSSQLTVLVKKANILRRTGLLYRKKLETRSSDLQKAEAEVDLLGDEVEVLFNLLEKIYIALDHYSPILQHYPGIVEILNLVRRKLSGESNKPVRYS